MVRIVGLKPNASGDLRAAGGSLEFGAKHLPGVIAMLQKLQEAMLATNRAGGA